VPGSLRPVSPHLAIGCRSGEGVALCLLHAESVGGVELFPGLGAWLILLIAGSEGVPTWIGVGARVTGSGILLIGILACSGGFCTSKPSQSPLTSIRKCRGWDAPN
jgi:hypothetical protein